MQGRCSTATELCCNLKTKVFFFRRRALQAQETNLRTKWSVRAPVLGRQAKFTETVSASGRVAPKRPAGLPASPVTSADKRGCEPEEESGSREF